MSAYITLATPMTDAECVLDALADLGFDRSSVEVHAEARAMVGYEGTSRQQVANIIIRKKHIGTSSNDMGFANTATGFRLIVSDFDRGRFGQAWLSKLNARYDHHRGERERLLAEKQRLAAEEERRRLVEAQRSAVIEAAKKQGYRIEERQEQGCIRLVLSKRVY